MIKKSLLVGIAASVMLLSACNSDEVSKQTSSTENQVQLLLNSSGRGLVSRAAREVYTTISANNVDHASMKLYKFDAGEWVVEQGCFDQDEIQWNGGNSTITANIVKIKNLQPNTQYKVIAYAYNGSPCAYTVNEEGTSLVATNAPSEIEELFAGVSDVFQTDSEGRVTDLISIEMTRMVAGMLAYFYHIPVLKIQPGTTDLKAVRYINIYTGAKTTGFVFPTTSLYNGLGQQVEKTKILSFDLKDYIDDYDQQVTDANFSSTFEIAPKIGDITTLGGSIIKGCFILPFESHVAQSTLSVELEDAEGNTLKTWKVAYAKSEGDPYQFDIQRNSFYALGKKVNEEATEPQPGEDPSDPDNPADNPLDLSSEELSVSLIDRWDKLYYMVLE